MTKLKIAYFYPELLNLYGDTGNVEILGARAKRYGMDVEVLEVSVRTRVSSDFMSDVALVFMGGGPDTKQKEMYKDLLENKGPYLKDYIEKGGVGLYICGSYQLLGHYFKAADGSILDGLGVFDLHTQNFGDMAGVRRKPRRLIGNTSARMSDTILKDPVFVGLKAFSDTIVGFENHGGRTYLGEKAVPFAKIIKGNGNNAEDGTEGVIYKNSIGTYFHGPILSKNPHLADYLISKSSGVSVGGLDDTLIISAHKSALLLKT